MSTISAQARLVLAIGAPGFAERLLDVAGACLAHDAAALLIFHPAAPPTVLVDRLRPAERAWLYGDYLSGVYALSPFFRAAQKLKAPRVARVREIAPKGFAQSEYHRRYFALIGVDDMIGLLIPASDAETGHSARAIGEALRISNETVRVHRRNIYEKLGISSQGELFRWFLATRG